MSERLILLFISDVFAMDEKLQAELYEQFYELVYDMVLYLVRDHATAEDIIQEAFMRALEKPPRYIESSKIEGWLKTLTRHITFNYLRKTFKQRNDFEKYKTEVQLEAEDERQQVSVEKEVELKFLHELMRKAIRGLKPKYREVMELKYVHDLSYKEMTDKLGTTEGTVRQRLARAREAIKDMLHTEWG